MTENNYEFKGGDNFTGMHRDYHEIMMRNELKKGKGGYKFSWAQTKKSGPSFGGNQMDIAHNKYGREILLDIVSNALDKDGQPILSSELIKEIERILQSPGLMIGKPLEAVFDFVAADKVRAAVSSKYGKQKIDEAYIEEVISRAKTVEKFIANLKDGPGKKFAESRSGKCYLFDYGNQYTLSRDGPLHKHLSGEEAKLKSGKIIPAFSKPKFTRKDFGVFLRSLEYYQRRPDDVDRRIENIEEYLKKEEKPKNSNPELHNDCAIIYKAYAAYMGSMAGDVGKSFDELAREFSRKYPEGSIADMCKDQGFDFERFLPQME